MSLYRPPAALFVVTSMVDDWAGEGPAIIRWAARHRGAQQLPWPLSAMIGDLNELAPAIRRSVAQAIDRFFTQVEAEALGAVLARDYLV